MEGLCVVSMEDGDMMTYIPTNLLGLSISIPFDHLFARLGFVMGTSGLLLTLRMVIGCDKLSCLSDFPSGSGRET